MNKSITNYYKLEKIFGRDRATEKRADTSRRSKGKEFSCLKIISLRIVNIDDIVSNYGSKLDTVNIEDFDNKLPFSDIKSKIKYIIIEIKTNHKDIEDGNFDSCV